MPCRYQFLHKAERGITAIVISIKFCLAGVNSHPHINRNVTPGFNLKIPLRFDRCSPRVSCFMERGTKCITDNLKDIAVIALNGLTQNDMMTCLYSFPRFRMLARPLSAIFYVGKVTVRVGLEVIVPPFEFNY